MAGKTVPHCHCYNSIENGHYRPQYGRRFWTLINTLPGHDYKQTKGSNREREREKGYRSGELILRRHKSDGRDRQIVA